MRSEVVKNEVFIPRNPDRFVFIGCGDVGAYIAHAVGIFRHNDDYYFIDSNIDAEHAIELE